MSTRHCKAFDGHRLIASGPLEEVSAKSKQVVDRKADASVLIFDDQTSELIELDFRGSLDDVVRRTSALADSASDNSAADGPRRPGRPKLGVVAREVTLLPRHWQWLAGQPGGASVALRKLVDEARRSRGPADLARQSRDSAYKFMVALGGDLPGFEEATRALFAGRAARFEECLAPWPADVRKHALKLARGSFESQPTPA
jgi:hypothetical protein